MGFKKFDENNYINPDFITSIEIVEVAKKENPNKVEVKIYMVGGHEHILNYSIKTQEFGDFLTWLRKRTDQEGSWL